MEENEPLALPEQIDLRIISPSVVVRDLRFPAIATSTSVGELKNMIQEAIISQPTPDRQRLIFRGRVLANEGISLGDIFGPEEIRLSAYLTLHLVIRDLHPHHQGTASLRSSNIPMNQFETAAPATEQSASNPSTVHTARMRQHPQDQQQDPQGRHHRHVHLPQRIPQIPFSSLVWPPSNIQRQVAASHMGMVPPSMNVLQPNNVQQRVVAQTRPDANAIQFVANLQAPRANDNGSPAIASSGNHAGVGSDRILDGAAQPQNPVVPTSASFFTREFVVPNSDRLTITVNNSTLSIPLPHNGQLPLPDFREAASRSATASEQPGFRANFSRSRVSYLRYMIQQAQQRLNNIQSLSVPDARRDNETLSSESSRSAMQAHLDYLACALSEAQGSVNAIFGGSSRDGDAASSQISNNSLPRNPNLSTERLNERTPNGTNGGVHSLRTDENMPTSSNGATGISPRPPLAPNSRPESQHMNSTSPNVTPPPASSTERYIVSSPSGPRFTIYAPPANRPFVPRTARGQFLFEQFALERQQLLQELAVPPYCNDANVQASHIESNQIPRQRGTAEPDDHVINPNAFDQLFAQRGDQFHHVPGHLPNNAEPMQQQRPRNRYVDAHNANNNEFGRIVILAFGHAWLFLRVFGLAWLVSGGSGWQRPIIMVVVGFLAWFIVGRVVGMFEEVRRWWEESVVVQGANRQAGGQYNAMGRRHVREVGRQEGERSLLWEWVRYFQSGIVLFFASLLPGLEERMTRPREEDAEARRVEREQRERERSEARREESNMEEPQEADQSTVLADGGSELRCRNDNGKAPLSANSMPEAGGTSSSGCSGTETAQPQ